MKKPVSPLQFFGHLVWLDRRPLLDVLEPYRQRILTEFLYTFDAGGNPQYNFGLWGRAKKNWKTTDLVLSALYCLLVLESPQGNDCFLLANDGDQAADDLTLAKKLIAANKILSNEVTVKQRVIERNDGKGRLEILPYNDAIGAHGKTYLFVGYDEIHGYRKWDIFEALAPDPSRRDARQLCATYDSIYNTAGAPLFDLKLMAKRGEDPRMYVSWYSGDWCTDPDYADKEPEQRANPSMDSWNNPEYLDQQRRRLPTHKFRRLHLNLPGMPDGTFFDATKVLDCVVEGRKLLKPNFEFFQYSAFVDMSGGSSDDATLAIAHFDHLRERAVLDVVISQTGRPPFNPRHAIKKFAALLKEYGCHTVVGDRYAGETFRQDFQEHGVSYSTSELNRSQLYEALEPKVNAGEVELLDIPKMTEQLLGLVVRSNKIDHMLGEHDDWINSAAGALHLAHKPHGIDVDAAAVLGTLEVLSDSSAYPADDWY